MTPRSNGDIDTLLQLADWSRAVQVLRYRFALLRRRLRRPGQHASNPQTLLLRVDGPSRLNSS